MIGYAKWSVPAAIMVWLLNNVLLFALNQRASISDVAGFKASTTLLLPINQMLIGLSLFLLPAWARQHQANNSLAVFHSAFWLAGWGVFLSLAMGLVVDGLTISPLALVFGEAYQRYDGALKLAAVLLPSTWVVVTILRTLARSLGKPKLVFEAYLATTALAAPGVVYLATPYGALGAVWGAFALQLLIVVFQFLLIGLFVKRNKLWRQNALTLGETG